MTLNGGVPFEVISICAVLPSAQRIAPPLIVAEGSGLTVTITDPFAVLVQKASVTSIKV